MWDCCHCIHYIAVHFAPDTQARKEKDRKKIRPRIFRMNGRKNEKGDCLRNWTKIKHIYLSLNPALMILNVPHWK